MACWCNRNHLPALRTLRFPLRESLRLRRRSLPSPHGGRAQGIHVGHRLSTAFAFVGGQDHRLAALVQRLGDHLVAGGNAGAGIDHEQDGLRLSNGGHALLGHAAGDRAWGRVFKAGGVDHLQLQAMEDGIADPAVARHTRRVMHDRDPAADQAVENTGFADVGPAYDCEDERHDIKASGCAVGHQKSLYRKATSLASSV
jgi:hypothetical protein